MNRLGKKLPFDILCIVFDYYAEFDSPAEPLETVLLVCKSWLNAASNYKALWSRFNMEISEVESAVYWTACVARRLNRTSSNGLLDIKIHLITEFKPGFSAACESLLHQLVGESGDVARRWRCVHMIATGPHFDYKARLLTKYFCYPTPHLQEFKCAGLGGNHTILPDSPSLKIFHAVALDVHPYPDLSHVTDLEINARWPSRIDERALALAGNVEHMKLRSWQPFKLTATYTRLRTFYIDGFILRSCLEAFRAPNLVELFLGPDSIDGYINLGSCKEIAFSSIQRASIKTQDSLVRPSIDIARNYCNATRRLLMSMTNLETLEVINGKPFYPILLKLLTDDLQSLYKSHTLSLVLGGHMAELGGKEGGMCSVQKLREELGLVDDCSWEELFALYKVALADQ